MAYASSQEYLSLRLGSFIHVATEFPEQKKSKLLIRLCESAGWFAPLLFTIAMILSEYEIVTHLISFSAINACNVM